MYLTLQVTSTLELQELRLMLICSKTTKTPFLALKVTYTFDLEENLFVELDTQDYGNIILIKMGVFKLSK